jgi:hypothetical protein
VTSSHDILFENNKQITSCCTLVQVVTPASLRKVSRIEDGRKLNANGCSVRELQKISRRISQQFGSLHFLNQHFVSIK